MFKFFIDKSTFHLCKNVVFFSIQIGLGWIGSVFNAFDLFYSSIENIGIKETTFSLNHFQRLFDISLVGGYHAGYAAPAVVGGYGVSKVVSPVGAYAAPAVYGGAYAHGMYLLCCTFI